jgi:hypothetical protein
MTHRRRLRAYLLVGNGRSHVALPDGSGPFSSAPEITMSIFGSIMSKIFHRGGGQAGGGAPAAQTAQAAPAGSGSAAPSGAAGTASSTSGGAGAAPAGAPSQGSVDVEAVLTELAGKAGQKLDWRHSIVDLMKLLDLDSSLSARKELAAELHYTGDTNDSASMNIWLHRQVMQKLAENGGKVPDSLKG